MATALLLQLSFCLIIGQTGIDLFAVQAAGPSLLDEKMNKGSLIFVSREPRFHPSARPFCGSPMPLA